MRHQKKGRKLGVDPSHRKAMLRNLASNLIEHKRIKTTDARAKELRTFIEPLITKAKRGDLNSIRQISKKLPRKEIVNQLIHDVGIQNLPVTFVLDRAGIVGADGPTHQGQYDLSLIHI